MVTIYFEGSSYKDYFPSSLDAPGDAITWKEFIGSDEYNLELHVYIVLILLVKNQPELEGVACRTLRLL